MSIIERALRVGEGKKFKTFEKRVGLINTWEAELELDDDAELRERATALRERARNGDSLDELLPESFALTREAARLREQVPQRAPQPGVRVRDALERLAREMRQRVDVWLVPLAAARAVLARQARAAVRADQGLRRRDLGDFDGRRGRNG